MIIVWRGLGFLIPLFVLFSVWITTRFPTNERLSGGLALLVSAVLLYFLGARMNREIKKGHTLFWIPMQYWAIVLGVFAPLIIFGKR
jgi:hypothetical protein